MIPYPKALQKLFIYLALMAAVLGGVACVSNGGDGHSDTEVHLLVDSVTVARGKWEELAAPMTWWIDPYGPDTLYQMGIKRFTREQALGNAAHSYLNDVLKDGHYSFLSRAAPSAVKDAVAGLEALELLQEKQNLETAWTKFKENGEDADLSEEDSKAIQLKEAHTYENIFRAYALANAEAFYYDQWVKRPG